VSELRGDIPQLLDRRSDLDIETPVFFVDGKGPCYVPDRTGNNEYVDARDSDYEFS
jgi:hypothetical protein